MGCTQLEGEFNSAEGVHVDRVYDVGDKHCAIRTSIFALEW